jgi:oxalate decarboxylase
VVLELFAADEFVHVSFNRWLRRLPSEMLDAHLKIDKEMAQKRPAEKLYLV